MTKKIKSIQSEM